MVWVKSPSPSAISLRVSATSTIGLLMVLDRNTAAVITIISITTEIITARNIILYTGANTVSIMTPTI
jgi:hypothetical protein